MISAMGFAAPSRLVLEAGGRRFPTYVTNFETDCIWLLVGVPVDHLPLRANVRLTIRDGDGPSLGLRGRLRWVSRDRLAVTVDHPVDRRIVEQWRRGQVADVPEDWVAEEITSVDLEPVPIDALSDTRPRDSASFAITVEDYVEDRGGSGR